MYTQYISTFYQIGEKVNNTLQNNKIDPLVTFLLFALWGAIFVSGYILYHGVMESRKTRIEKYETT